MLAALLGAAAIYTKMVQVSNYWTEFDVHATLYFSIEVSRSSMHIPAWLQKNIIEAIAHARKEAKLSRVELSLKLGKTPNLMQKIETGLRDVTAAEFVVIVRTIGADPGEVLQRALKK